MLKVDLSPNDLLSIGGRTRHLANPVGHGAIRPGTPNVSRRQGGLFSFTSILFPPGIEHPPPTATEPPACFIDLNLDQVVSAMADKRDEDVLRPIFYSSYRDVDIARYRQAVFTDLDRSDVFQAFPTFCDAMRTVRQIELRGKISYKCHRHMVILRAIGLYCDTVTSLASNLASFALKSSGLRSLQAYLQSYINSLSHSRLATETRELQDIISKLSYGMLFRGDKATVRKYADEPDYTATILERFSGSGKHMSSPPLHRGQRTISRSITSKKAFSNLSGGCSRGNSALWQSMSLGTRSSWMEQLPASTAKSASSSPIAPSSIR